MFLVSFWNFFLVVEGSYVLLLFFFKARADLEILVLGQLRGRVSSKLSTMQWHMRLQQRLMAKLLKTVTRQLILFENLKFLNFFVKIVKIIKSKAIRPLGHASYSDCFAVSAHKLAAAMIGENVNKQLVQDSGEKHRQACIRPNYQRTRHFKSSNFLIITSDKKCHFWDKRLQNDIVHCCKTLQKAATCSKKLEHAAKSWNMQ